MPMQPRPIADTSGPSRPSRRLPIWNIAILPFGQPPKSSTTQSPARVFGTKWGADPLVTTGRAGKYRHFGTADPKRLGDQRQHRLVRRTVGRRSGDMHLE